MPEPTRPTVIEKLMLATFVGTAVASFAVSQAAFPAWFLLAPCAVALFAEVKSLPASVQTAARYVAWGGLGALFVLGVIFVGYPILSPQTTRKLILVAGYALASLSTLFLLGRPVWPVASTLFPCTLGTLVVASFNPSAPLRGNLAVAAAAVFAWLELRRPPPRRATARDFWDWRGTVFLAVSAAGTFLIAWGIIRALPWAQARVEQATFRFFTTSTTHYSSLSLESRLGDLEQLKLSPKVVMRVWTSRPQKLRGRIFTHFDGVAWHARVLAAQPLSPAGSAPSRTGSVAEWLDAIPGSDYLMPGRTAPEAYAPDLIPTKVVQEVFNSGMLVSPGGKLLVRLRVDNLKTDPFEGLAASFRSDILLSDIRIFGVLNRRTGDVVQAGQAAPQLLGECLALPQDTDGRLRDLAASLAEKAATPAERIQSTLSYLQSHCHYSLTLGRFHSRQPIAEFLFEKRQGYCEYFASAAAVLLRLEGVPCRYVTGFNVQEGNRQAGHYVVREADAHAWIEAYLPGRGWVEADPTPEAEYQALHANLRGGAWSAAQEWLQTEIEELSIRLRGGDWLAGLRWVWISAKILLRQVLVEHFGLILLVLALLLVGVGVTRRRRRKGGRRHPPGLARAGDAPVPGELAELLMELDNLWARQGHARPAWRAPREHLARLPGLSAEFRGTSRAIIECFYRRCYGGIEIPRTEIEALRRELERVAAL